MAVSQTGWENTWMPLFYLSIITTLVLVQGFLLPGGAGGLREFFWVSIFVLLTTPFLQFAPLQLDHYNFSLITNMHMTHIPYMLGLLVNVGLACGAGLLFHLLWEWQYSTSRGSNSALRRAAWVTLASGRNGLCSRSSNYQHFSIHTTCNSNAGVSCIILVVLLVLRDSRDRSQRTRPAIYFIHHNRIMHCVWRIGDSHGCCDLRVPGCTDGLARPQSAALLGNQLFYNAVYPRGGVRQVESGIHVALNVPFFLSHFRGWRQRVGGAFTGAEEVMHILLPPILPKQRIARLKAE